MAVNAPEAGTIRELLVNEEDTVTVGQDLLRLEPGSGAADKVSKPEQNSNESKPETKTGKDGTAHPGNEEKPTEPKPAPSGRSTSAEPQDNGAHPKPPANSTLANKDNQTGAIPSKESPSAPLGSREERRVSYLSTFFFSSYKANVGEG